MSKKTLKFDNDEVNKKEFHISKQPISYELVNVDQISISDIFKHSDTVLNILLAAKMIISLDRYVLFYLK